MKELFEDKEICFGVHTGPVGDFETLKENCLNAEKLGYDLFTLWDHLMAPAIMLGQPMPPQTAMDCWSTLAGLAAVTNKIQLGTLVTCVFFRHPTILAKMAITVDSISRGRLILGLGAGWMKEEFESFLGEYPSVKKRLDGLEDAAIICKSMLEKDHTNYKGRIFSAKDISRERSMPRPTREFIPIMIGGSGEKRTLKIAAKYADIVHFALPFHPGLMERKISVLKNHCKAVGRDFDEITLSTFLHAVLRSSQDLVEMRAKRFVPYYGMSEVEAREAAEITSGPESLVETVKLGRDIGIKLFTLSQVKPSQLETFKKEVIMKL